MNKEYRDTIELATSLCRILGLERCTKLSLHFNFEGLATAVVEAEILVGVHGEEVQRCIEMYRLHPEKIEDQEEVKDGQVA